MALNVKPIPWHYQVALFAVAAIAALGGFYYFHEAPARAELAVKQQQLDALRQEIARGRATAQKLQEFQAQVTDLQARLDGLKAVLPEQKDVGDLLRRIQTLATQSNLEIRAFKPQAIVTKQVHAEWPISLELAGSYHDLGMFFDKVSKVPRIINVSGINIKGLDERGRPQTDRVATITAQCLATTFVLLENRAPAPGTPAAPQGAQR
ncbi:MAG: type 4a pilus biogenesis protein PilO [Vicinamibacterales bacterium]|jgi:type IV pilus assembly protein PilO|nr:type 4a pilus biogenesis protein PilO [Vicinamibacterales bacterium]